MVLYSIIIVPLEEELQAVDTGLLSPFYADDAVFVVFVGRIAQLLKLIL